MDLSKIYLTFKRKPIPTTDINKIITKMINNGFIFKIIRN